MKTANSKKWQATSVEQSGAALEGMRGEGRYGVGVVGASVPVFADNSELIKRATRRRIHLGTQSDINSVYDNNNKTTIEALITKGDNNE